MEPSKIAPPDGGEAKAIVDVRGLRKTFSKRARGPLWKRPWSITWSARSGRPMSKITFPMPMKRTITVIVSAARVIGRDLRAWIAACDAIGQIINLIENESILLQHLVHPSRRVAR